MLRPPLPPAVLLPDLKHSSSALAPLLEGAPSRQGSQGLVLAQPQDQLSPLDAELQQEPRKWHWLSPMELQATQLQQQLSSSEPNLGLPAALTPASAGTSRQPSANLAFPFPGGDALALQQQLQLQQQQQQLPLPAVTHP
ncbi:MAG: hypothetical protein WDW38_004406 [Sanguina aurantia]